MKPIILFFIHIVCLDVIAQKVGIGTNSPTQTFDVNGKVKIGDDATTPTAGTVRWNAARNDFEGFDGTRWKSLTNTAQWGKLETFKTENTKITASDGLAFDNFGTSVSIAGDYAIIGAPSDDNGGNVNQGSAYIFVRSGNFWTQQAKITASDGAANDNFGSSVSIDGDYAIIGAYSDDVGSNTNQGSAYIFVRSGSSWTQQAKLTASDGGIGDNFGAVSINGDYAVVGAASDDTGSNIDQGSAYIFIRSGASWTQQAKLTASDGAQYDYFGAAVSISSTHVVVGAWLDNVGSNLDVGSAYIFSRSGTTWTQQANIFASDGASEDGFGYSVAISGDYVIIGSFGDSVGSNVDQGSAFIFMRTGSTWTQQIKLIAPDGENYDEFGYSVAIYGDHAIIGAQSADFGYNSNLGAAYVFNRSGNNWYLQTKLAASDGGPSDSFGKSVAIGSNYAIVGAAFDDIESSNDQGSCYLFKKN